MVDKYGDRNAVPPGYDNAGPGCWECADCGLIISMDETDSRRCLALSEDDDGRETAETEQRGIGDY